VSPPETPNRYCRRHAGELIHIDIKKLGRFDRPGHRVTGQRGGINSNRHAGWEFVHVAIDDTSRVAYLEVLADEKGSTYVGFLERAIAWFAEQGVTVQRVMTDNGTGYRSKSAPSRNRPARHHAHHDSALPATHQRQSRAAHPDHVARLCLWSSVPKQRTTTSFAATMAHLLQLSATPQRPRPPNANLTTGTGHLNNAPGIYS
jgi:hypothetical protein